LIQFFGDAIVNVSVIVPTYRRTADLARCLAALDAQQRRADEVVVIVRDDDRPTHEWLASRSAQHPDARLRIAQVSTPGVVAAYNRGIDSATGEIVCFTDDDAAPHPDWIERIERAFECDPALGGLGGRDVVHEHGRILQGEKAVVGRVQWFGRAIGNHHIGHGAAREVDVLKAVNMAFRRAAIGTLRFDPRLRGSGAQVHCEMAFSLDVGRRGWKLVYDPTLLVEHYPAPRGDEDQRQVFNAAAFYNASFNLRLIMCEHLSTSGRWAFVTYATLIGNRADPGLVRAITLAFNGESLALALRKWWVGLCAMHGAWRAAMR
jgi:glycosyltransferase involved in cell wall biosynthesis